MLDPLGSALSRVGIIAVDMTPPKFYKLAQMIQEFTPDQLAGLDSLTESLFTMCTGIDEEAEQLAKANNALLAEARATSRRRNPFSSEQEDPFSDLRHSIDGQNFLRVIFDVVSAIQRGYQTLHEVSRGIRPGQIMLNKKRSRGIERFGDGTFDGFDDFTDVQSLMFEMQMNAPIVDRFINGLYQAESAKNNVISLGRLITDKLDRYYQLLLHRHSVEGIKIHCDPVTTDIAMSIFENVDAHGEIQDGKKADEISAYSMRKAAIIVEAVRGGLVGEFIRKPDRFIDFIKTHMGILWKVAQDVSNIAAPFMEDVRKIVGQTMKKQRMMSDAEFEQALVFINDLDPQSVAFKEKTGLLSSEERFELNIRNETLKEVTRILASKGMTTDSLIQYILQRKQHLRDYYQDENSFYVCKIGNGNPFTGSAPGELTVIPGSRPVVNLDEILGSGFDEVKGFIGQVEESSKWFDLFLATSPSRSADKSNVLLIGPVGCGKSEILRAVGGDKKSVGVFATGADFLTCWKGEAEKNPKRLFEAALQIAKESKKHTHILIDEIDTILNKNEGRDSFGSTNLVTEFQNLMDGVVRYPDLSVWGATNNPEKIPMPCLRRFAKVLIVGELSQEDRVKLLKHFSNFLPVGDVTEDAWNSLAMRLNGATGDIHRKVVDHIWREKMTWFVRNHRETAQKLVDQLSTDQGQKFDLSDFTASQRETFKKALSPYVQIHAKDIDASITAHLENVAIHHEIKTAVETYERARGFLAQLKQSTIAAQTES